jgi:hypothetical protein
MRLPYWPTDSTSQTDIDNGGRMFLLFNATDQVYVSPEEFKTVAEAEAYGREFRNRFKAQGYYLTAGCERIPPEDVELVIESVNP